jgi:hypothetical protein
MSTHDRRSRLIAKLAIWVFAMMAAACGGASTSTSEEAGDPADATTVAPAAESKSHLPLDPCALVKPDELRAYSVDPANATAIGSDDLFEGQVALNGCIWTGAGNWDQVMTAALIFQQFDDAGRAAAALEDGSLDDLASTDPVDGLGDPATTTEGRLVPGALASYGSPNGKPEHQVRYAGFVVARFGDTIIEWTTTTYASALNGNPSPDESPPDLRERAALIKAILTRTDALVPDDKPVTRASVAQMHQESLPAIAELRFPVDLRLSNENTTSKCDMAVARGPKGSWSVSPSRFAASDTSGDLEWYLAVGETGADIKLRDGSGNEASYIRSINPAYLLGSGDLRLGPLFSRADFDATFVREPGRPQTIPGLPPEIKIEGTVRCGPPLE